MQAGGGGTLPLRTTPKERGDYDYDRIRYKMAQGLISGSNKPGSLECAGTSCRRRFRFWIGIDQEVAVEKSWFLCFG